jgi:hypothetical protein
MPALELEILGLTNDFRREQQLGILRWHEELAVIAKQHATAVASCSAPFSHAGAHERFASCPTKCINMAENLARSDGFGRDYLSQAAVHSWCESEGHRRNLLGPFDVCGIGWAASDEGVIFVTQLLALVDERSSSWTNLQKRTRVVATSTPAICGALGLVVSGPIVAVGSGLVGGALDYMYGLKATNLPAIARDRVRGYFQRHACQSCGAIPSGGAASAAAAIRQNDPWAEAVEPHVDNQGLYASSIDGRLLCSKCNPASEQASNWLFVE